MDLARPPVASAIRPNEPVRADVPPTPDAPRVLAFDLLRAFGLLSIVLAHVEPPEELFLLRNFDVPLLILVSGAVFQLGGRGRPIAFGAYVKKRAIRLVAPTYVFLIFYFALAAVVAPERFGAEVIVRTFLLLDGMGYVWVIRVFLFVALAAPLLRWWKQRTSRAVFFACLAAVYVADEALWLGFEAADSFAGAEVVEYSIFYLLPYGAMFALGLRWPEMSRREAWLWGAGGLWLCGVLMVTLYGAGESISTWPYKYPPRSIYVWYGVGVAHVLFALVLGIRKLRPSIEAAVRFVSASSLWIYLWHILGVQIARKLLEPWGLGAAEFAFAWVITVAFAVGATRCQHAVVGRILRRGELSEKTAATLKVLFLK